MNVHLGFSEMSGRKKCTRESFHSIDKNLSQEKSLRHQFFIWEQKQMFPLEILEEP